MKLYPSCGLFDKDMDKAFEEPLESYDLKFEEANEGDDSVLIEIKHDGGILNFVLKPDNDEEATVSQNTRMIIKQEIDSDTEPEDNQPMSIRVNQIGIHIKTDHHEGSSYFPSPANTSSSQTTPFSDKHCHERGTKQNTTVGAQASGGEFLMPVEKQTIQLSNCAAVYSKEQLAAALEIGMKAAFTFLEQKCARTTERAAEAENDHKEMVTLASPFPFAVVNEEVIGVQASAQEQNSKKSNKKKKKKQSSQKVHPYERPKMSEVVEGYDYDWMCLYEHQQRDRRIKRLSNINARPEN